MKTLQITVGLTVLVVISGCVVTKGTQVANYGGVETHQSWNGVMLSPPLQPPAGTTVVVPARRYDYYDGYWARHSVVVVYPRYIPRYSSYRSFEDRYHWRYQR